MRWLGFVVLLSGCVASPCTGELVPLGAADGCGITVRELDRARTCLLPPHLLRVPSALSEERACTVDDTGRLFVTAYPVVYGRPGAEALRECTEAERLAGLGAPDCP